MNETTTMLANIIKITIGNIPLVYSPQLSIEDKIKELRQKNKSKELIGYDEDGNEQYKYGDPVNKELEEALNILSIVCEKDKAKYNRFKEAKLEVLEDKLKSIDKIVSRYSDIEKED